MSRPVRLEYAGAVYHVMSRGMERGSIFRDDRDRDGFLGDVGRVVRERRWAVHGYCLMTNHYHLLVETPEANLSVGMQLLNGWYSQAFNKRHSRKGHLFEDRYKAIVVEKEAYLLELCRYVVLNPVRAGIVRAVREYRWSNYRATSGESRVPDFLEVGWTLGRFGKSLGSARERYRRFVADGAGARSPMDDVTGQVYLGRAAFVKEMRRRLEQEDVCDAIPRAQRNVGSIPLGAVISSVAAEYRLDVQELVSAWRRGEERAVAIHLARRLCGLSAVKIAERFGVTAARVSQLGKSIELSGDAKLKRRVASLEERLKSWP
jgi:putative transposase